MTTALPKMSLIGSQGHLASWVFHHYQNSYDIQVFGQDKYDIRNRNTVDYLSQQMADADVIINCAGLLGDDSWDELLVNAVAPIYLLTRLTELQCRARFIQIGSHSAMWTSWPGVEVNRLCYNVSKQCLQSAVTGLSHSGKTNMLLTIINPSKFKSAMSNWGGYEVSAVIEYIDFAIKSQNPPVLLEMEAVSARLGNTTRN
jgi:NAD(P)-dependent dehydrogenase (short-subunit alcohol dehydrogenase family)